MHWGYRTRVSVLDCGSPLPLSDATNPAKSARGLAQSKTSRQKGQFMNNGNYLFPARFIAKSIIR